MSNNRNPGFELPDFGGYKRKPPSHPNSQGGGATK